ncbi:sugar transferase [Silicimonas algicola]|uniref:Lipopolysaccharide/colanic/teichoic acid biosynthesis glycosyltransferase n=1 Tax=Silicimonas algicola TaxID=1826607 RepID=A0A316GEQ6_9RHOB|nr:sugar transferase [Silicimonas algicola]AZQ66740.1 sugar transferase [Silicimonas algicola]PWK53147.1 lipopolysaccharide/colanic/teichoic acid biosynthesis glycosyltransferase [Silicimonas algicola]
MYSRDFDKNPILVVAAERQSGIKLERVLSKRAFDLILCPFGLVLTAFVGILLFLLNPLFNPGPLLYSQHRMGLYGDRFTMLKFRTMLPEEVVTNARPATAPLEVERITPLGRILRRFRLDELPNFVNVWRGEMSVVGPRPDAWEHSHLFWQTVPRYSERFRVRPGITGLAQVQGGYADSANAIRRKARFDSYYVRRASFALEAFIIWRTVVIFFSGFGAR